MNIEVAESVLVEMIMAIVESVVMEIEMVLVESVVVSLIIETVETELERNFCKQFYQDAAAPTQPPWKMCIRLFK